MIGKCAHCGKKIPLQKYTLDNGDEVWGAKKGARTVHVTQSKGGTVICFDRPKRKGE